MTNARKMNAGMMHMQACMCMPSRADFSLLSIRRPLSA